MAAYFEKRKPDGASLKEEGAKWLDRIEAAGKLEKEWMDDAEAAVAAYTSEARRSEVDPATSTAWKAYDFNILFSNVETIVPAVINSPPAPDIRRRFADKDPAAKDVSEILERAIRVQIDDSRLQVELEGTAQDAFLAGRGVIRLRFKSDVDEGERLDDELEDAAEELEAGGVGPAGGDERSESDGSEYDGGDDRQKPQQMVADGIPNGGTSKNERICFEAVSWRDYRHGPAKRWDERPWEAFRFTIEREDAEFFDAGIISAQFTPEERKQWDESSTDLSGWEIWCKKTRKVKFIDDKGHILKVVDDPLELSSFFSTATPIQPIELVGRLRPVNPFSIYRKLAEELDLTTKRIRLITDQMKVKGWYAGDATDLANIVSAEDTDFIPISNAEIWAQNGGLKEAVAFWPIENFIIVLTNLYESRDQTKQAIYEITGISDIVRGASDSKETLGAQQIKTQWGSLRIQKQQRALERCARDLFVMMAEIIPTKFSRQTLEQMTGIQLIPTEQDLTPIQPPPMPPMMPGQEPPPELMQAQQQAQQAEAARQEKLAKMQAVDKLLSERLATYFRIDVESDSTVRADLTRQKAESAEFLQGAASYFAAVGPLVQEGALPMDAAVEIFAANARMFNLGKSVEDTLDKMLADAKEKAAQPPPPSPEQQKAEAEAQALQKEMEFKEKEFLMKEKAETAKGEREAAADDRKVNLESQLANIKLQIANKDLEIKDIELSMKREEVEIKRAEVGLKLDAQHQSNAIKLDGQRQANELKADAAKTNGAKQ
jgi:hypothetical protein